MSSKFYNLIAGGHSVIVEAEKEGASRFMVRMSIPGKVYRVRIGYLTGAHRTWVAEFFGKTKPSALCISAKDACQEMANWAVKQESIAAFLVSQANESIAQCEPKFDADAELRKDEAECADAPAVDSPTR